VAGVYLFIYYLNTLNRPHSCAVRSLSVTRGRASSRPSVLTALSVSLSGLSSLQLLCLLGPTGRPRPTARPPYYLLVLHRTFNSVYRVMYRNTAEQNGFSVLVLVALQQVDDSRARPRAARLSRAAACGRAPSPHRHGRLWLRLRSRRVRRVRRVPRRLPAAAPRRHREVVVLALAVTRQPALLLGGLGLGCGARSLWRRRRLALGRLVTVQSLGQRSGSGSGARARARARARTRASAQWCVLGGEVGGRGRGRGAPWLASGMGAARR
jgi:hypothetical protein